MDYSWIQRRSMMRSKTSTNVVGGKWLSLKVSGWPVLSSYWVMWIFIQNRMHWYFSQATSKHILSSTLLLKDWKPVVASHRSRHGMRRISLSPAMARLMVTEIAGVRWRKRNWLLHSGRNWSIRAVSWMRNRRYGIPPQVRWKGLWLAKISTYPKGLIQMKNGLKSIRGCVRCCSALWKARKCCWKA